MRKKARYSAKFNSLVAELPRSVSLREFIGRLHRRDALREFNDIMSAIEVAVDTKSPMVFDRVIRLIDDAVNKQGLIEIPQQFGTDDYISRVGETLIKLTKSCDPDERVAKYISRVKRLASRPCTVSEVLNTGIITIKLIDYLRRWGLDNINTYHVVQTALAWFPLRDSLGAGFSDVKNIISDDITSYDILGVWLSLSPTALRVLSLLKLYYKT